MSVRNWKKEFGEDSFKELDIVGTIRSSILRGKTQENNQNNL